MFYKNVKQVLKTTFFIILSICLILQPITPTLAQVIIDNSAPINNQPTITSAPNGVPSIDIVQPNNEGISHNKFTDYNVGTQGLILNNSKNIGVSTLGGAMINNPNLNSSASASIILNEVTSTNPSLLQGFTEVFGDSAEIIVANPNGITCHGCGFINTPQATLTTGLPEFDGSGALVNFNINNGSITVDGDGFDATDNNSKARFLARAIEINANIHADEIEIVSGRNDYDPNTGTPTPKSDDLSSKPTFGIDSSSLGGMYANKITLIGTEAGVGFKLDGDMATNISDLQLTADGKITAKNAASAQDIKIISNNNAIEIDGRFTADNDINMDAATDIVLSGDTLLQADGSALNISAGDTLQNNGGVILSNDNTSINADQIINDRGWFFAANTMTLEGQTPSTHMNLLQNSSGVIEVMNGDLIIRADTLINETDAVVSTDTTVIGHQFIRSSPPVVPRGGTSSAVWNQIYYDGSSSYVIIPHPDVVEEILALEGITLAEWTPTLWQSYVPDYSTLDTTKWSLHVPDEAQNAPSGSQMLFYYETDTLSGDYIPATIMTVNNGNIIIDVSDITNDKSTISAANDLTINGNNLINNGLELTDSFSIGLSYNNATTIRNIGWGGWISHGTDGPFLKQQDIIGELPATIAAGGTLSGTLSGDVTNLTSPVTAVENMSFGTGSDTIVRTQDNRNPVQNIYVNPARFTPAPLSSNTVFETRAIFTDLGNFYGSDYFLSSLSTPFDADDLPRRLGDAYYDTQSISQQIFDQTGRRSLMGQSTDLEAQMQSLLDNGAAFANSLSLSIGVALTPEQQANLTNDIVWYETIEYNGETVLAPRLYLAAISLENLPEGASRIIAGNDLNLDATNIVSVDGTIQSDKDIRLAAVEDIALTGGLINGDNITLTAGEDVTIAMQITNTGNNHNIIGTIYDDTAKVNATNDLTINSGGSTTIAGTDITVGNDMDVTTGEDTSIISSILRSFYDMATGDWEITKNTTKNIETTIQVGNDVNIQALNNVNVVGSSIEAGNDLNLDAAIGDVNIMTSVDERYTRGYKSTSTATRDDVTYTQTHQGSTLISGGNTTLRSGLGDVNLQAAEIDSGNDINLEASSGQVNITVAKDLDYHSNTLNRDGAAWIKMENEGHHLEEIKHTILTGEGDLNITTAEGVTIQYEPTGDLNESIDQLSQAPGLAWMADFKNDPNVNWQAVQAINKEWSENHEGLSGPAAAVIAIAIAIATQGMGAGLVGLSTTSTAGLSASAAFSALASQATIALINNKGDLGATFSDLASSDTVRNVAAAALTAGLTKEFSGGQLQSRPSNLVSPDLANHIKQEFLSSIIKSGVDTTINGGSITNNLKDNLQFGTSAVFGAQFSKAVGTLIKAGEINKAQQLISHGLIGCISSSIGGGSCGSAATGALLGEAVADLAHNGLGLNEQQSATLGRYAALSSTLATADSALDVTYSNLAASNAINNNFLLPKEKQELVDKLSACGNNAQCENDAIEPFQSISDSRDKAFIEAYDVCKENADNCGTFFEYHYDIREQLNQEGNEYYQGNSLEFVLLPNSKAIYHTFVTNDQGEVINVLTEQLNYRKLIHPVLGYEVVLDEQNNIVTDPLNAGTYNFYNPSGNNPLIGGFWPHTTFDVTPYYDYGNSTSDPTSYMDRVLRNGVLIWGE